MGNRRCRAESVKAGDLLQVLISSLHLTVALQRGKKGSWLLRSECPKPLKDHKETPEDWWLSEGCPVRELKFNSSYD